MNWIVDEISRDKNEATAGGKARNDIQTLATEYGFSRLHLSFDNKNRGKTGVVLKIISHIKAVRSWNTVLQKCKEGDNVLIQFPPLSHTLFLKYILIRYRRKGISFFAIIHDLETIRNAFLPKTAVVSRIRIRFEETSVLKFFKKIIVHNEKMEQYLNDKYRINSENMCSLEIFDYLFEPSDIIAVGFADVVIAGNLRKDKAAYIYALPPKPIFYLYGVNYQLENEQNNIFYKGVFPADELPNYLQGKFGLVWDGESAETCTGQAGEYLKYNNPHKASLYLAAGIPVIIWSKAALAQFVVKEKCGITVDSLDDINDALREMDEEEYLILRRNAEKIGEVLKSGYYFKEAIKKCGLLNLT